MSSYTITHPGIASLAGCLATLKQLKAGSACNLTECMSLGEMLTVYMTLNWQHGEPWPKFAVFLLHSAFNVGFSGETFQKSVLLKWTRFLRGMSRLLWMSHLLYYLLYIRLPLSLSLLVHSVRGALKWFKCRRVVIYSCSVGRLMIAHQERWKKRGNLKLKFGDISKKRQLNYGLSTCKFPRLWNSLICQQCFWWTLACRIFSRR